MADGGTRNDITAGVMVWSSGEYRASGAATK
jgi:hypothetical protein